jgi:hypothetical protein
MRSFTLRILESGLATSTFGDCAMSDTGAKSRTTS